MRLWIDGQCLQTASRERGIGRYVLGLISGLAGRPNVELSISFNAAMPEALVGARELVKPWIAPKNVHAWQGIANQGEAVSGYDPHRQASEIALAHHVACLAPDLALVPSMFEGFGDVAVPLMTSKIAGVASACIIYDLIPLHYPERFLPTVEARTFYERRFQALKTFPIAFAISDFTRRDLMERGFLGEVVNIAAGMNDAFSVTATSDNPVQADADHYLLYVGSLDWHKNAGVIAEAVAMLPDPSRRRVGLKLVGSEHPPHLDAMRAGWTAAGLDAGRLTIEGHVSDTRLASLYRKALALVHPSRIEGFGLTPLEAMHFGTPVIVSTAGALTEVVGEAGLSFDPDSPAALSAAIQSLMSQSEAVAALRRAGFARAATFTWERSATGLLASLPASPIAGRQEKLQGLALRRRAARVIADVNLSTDDKVHVMALAEPIRSGRPKLVVDATATLISPARTGIQRVVSLICSNLSQSQRNGPGDKEVVIASSLRSRFWHEIDVKEVFFESSVLTHRIITFDVNDTILMLDSSWEMFPWHHVSLQRARLRGARIVSCLYDMTPLTHSAFCDGGMPPAFANWLGACLTYSDAFVCISKAVADEFLTFLQSIRFPRRIDVGFWHLGADFSRTDAAVAAAEMVSKSRPLFLMVGTLEPRKGHAVALDACSRLWEEGCDFDLVMIGKEGWNTASLLAQLKAHPEFGSRLRWLASVTDAKLGAFYGACDALLATSYAEGFGLPIVEARHFGKPVIASDIPVFREVAGDAEARYFQVGSADGLAGAMRDFLEAPHQASAEIHPWLSWKESAAELRRIVLDEDWYTTYKPEKPSYAPMRSALELARMNGPVAVEDRCAGLELVEAPTPERYGMVLRCVVKVTNASSAVWASSSVDGSPGVNLSYALADAEGRPIHDRHERSRAAIPFVLGPGESHYMSLEIPANAATEGAAFADIQMVEEGVAWWGNQLRVALR